MSIRLPLLILLLSTWSATGEAQGFPSGPPAQTSLAQFANSIAIAPQNPKLNLGTQFTMEAWLYMDAPVANGVIMGRPMETRTVVARAYGLLMTSDGSHIQFFETTGLAGSVKTAITPDAIPLHQWTHVAATLSGGTMRLFINGQQVASTNGAGTPPTPAMPFSLGSELLGTGGVQNSSFKGAIRQVRLWNRAMTSAELSANAGVSLSGTEADLAAWWPLDDASGQTAKDHGPNALDLTLGTAAGIDSYDPYWVRTFVLDSGPYFSLDEFTYPAGLQASNAKQTQGGVLVDFDNDGDLDLLVTQSDFSTFPPLPVYAFRNDGHGKFSDATAEVFGGTDFKTIVARQVIAADFNRDGRMDVLVGDHGYDLPPSPGYQSQILIQAPDGSMRNETTSRLPTLNAFTHGIAVGDVDGDGDLDIYLCNMNNEKHEPPRLYLNDGKGVFSSDPARLPPELQQVLSYTYTASTFVDVDKDGDLDLVLGGSGSGIDSTGTPYFCPTTKCTPTDVLLLNDGTGHFGYAPANAMPLRVGGTLWGTVGITTADFDQDGWPDLLMNVHDNYLTSRIQLLLNNGNGTFRDASDRLPAQSWRVGTPTLYSWMKWLRVGDFNGDGWPDFVSSGAEEPQHLFINTGEGRFENDSDLLPRTRTSAIRADFDEGEMFPADIDGDGDVDLVLAGTSKSYFVLHNEKPYTPTLSASLFNVASRGGASIATTDTPDLGVGYGSIQTSGNATNLDGLAIIGFRQNGVLVTEAGVPATKAISSGRIYAEVSNSVNTGLAIANPNAQAVTLTYYFTDSSGTNFKSGSTTLAANSQMARFLNEAPFSGGSFGIGTFTFTASQAVAVVALRGRTNERSEFLLTTLPVVDLGAAPSTSAVVFPHFAAGGGWTTEIALVNPSDSAISGTVQFVGPNGQTVSVRVDQGTASSFSYTIPARSSLRYRADGDSLQSGSVRVTPTGTNRAPSGLGIFAFQNAGVTVTEAGVPAIPASNAFRLYAEASGNFQAGELGSIQTGVAITNPGTTSATVRFEVVNLNGETTGLTGTATIPANGQTAMFLQQIQGLASLSLPFKGVLRISSDSGARLSIVGLRGRYNERGDFLITTTPPSDENAAPTGTSYFPHFVAGQGYSTQFVVFARAGSVSSQGFIRFVGSNGLPLPLKIK